MKLTYQVCLFLMIVSLSWMQPSSQIKRPIYADLELLGVSCEPQDTCDSTLSTEDPLVANFFERNCNCDEECSKYGDCCIDAQNKNDMDFRDFECMKFDANNPDGVYAKKSCPKNWQGNPDIETNCEAEFSHFNKDIISQMPVTSNLTGITYKNAYCAYCNEDNNGTVIWSPELACRNLNAYNATYQNLTEDKIIDMLQFNATSKKWGVSLWKDQNQVFYPCAIKPSSPSNIQHKIRPCRFTNIINTCSTSKKTFETSCHSYQALVFYGDLIFKNIHCAFCSEIFDFEEIIDHISCDPPVMQRISFNNWPQAFSVLLDLHIVTSNAINVITCASDQLFDPFFKTCRSEICGLIGADFANGKCIPYNNFNYSLQTTQTDNNKSRELEIQQATTSQIDGVIKVQSNVAANPCNTNFAKASKYRAEYNTFEMLNCSWIISLQMNEYLEFDNGTLYAFPFNKFYDQQFYFINNDSVILCSAGPDMINELLPFNAVYATTSIVISMLLLVICIIVVILLSEIKTISDKCVTCLAISLLLSYLLFLVDQNVMKNTNVCLILTSCIYYSYMASFFWLNTMGFDVWHSFRRATKNLSETASETEWRFIFYSLYSWLVTLIFPCAIICTFELSNMEFCNLLCWISNKQMLLIFLTLPSTIILTANIWFSFSSLCMIFKSSNNMRSKEIMNEFYLYNRLGLVMILTWLLSILDYSEYNKGISYVLIFYPFQGILIFISFCPRILELLKKFSKRNKTQKNIELV